MDPDLQIREGGGGGHPDPEIRRGAVFFSALTATVWSKNKGGWAPPLGPPLERVTTQRGNLRALAGIYEFHLVVFRGCN